MIPKFRAWDKTTNQMRGCYGFNDMEQEVYVCSVADDEFNGQLRTVHALKRSFDEVVVMQSTGLKDKNGVGIYEGDIVVASTGYYLNGFFNPMRHYKGVVKFGEYEQNASDGEYSGSKTIGFYGEFSYVNDGNDGYKKIESHDYEREESLLTFGKTEVIGNIYENLELMEVTE